MLKTNILHVRKQLTPRSKYVFKMGNQKIDYCSEYKYLGLLIDQFLNFEKMSNYFHDPTNRALNSVICKMIKNKGFPFHIFSTVYNACVTTVTEYAHEVIGFHQYSASYDIHSKAIRSYLGVGHSAPLCGIRYEMKLLEPRSRTQIRMMQLYFRINNLTNDRLTKKILNMTNIFPC